MKLGNSENIVVSKRLVVINSASSVLNRVLNVTVLVWLYQYLLNRIPPEEFAVFPVVSAIMVFAPLFFSLFTGGIARHVIDSYAKGNKRDVTAIVSSIAPLIFISATLFIVAGLTFSYFIGNILNIPSGMLFEARLMMSLLVLNFAVQMILLPFGIGYNIRQRFLEGNILLFSREIFRISLLLVLLLVFGAGVIWIVISTVVAEQIFQAIIFYRSRKMVPELHLDLSLFSLERARNLMSFGMWTSLGQLGAIMYTNAATIMLNLFGTPLDVTCYFIGATLFRQLEGLIISAILPLQPAVTAMNALGDNARLASVVLRGGRYGMWVSMLAAAPMMIFADDFIDLYLGPDYSQAAVVIILFMLIFPFNQSNALLPMMAVAMARVKEYFLPAFLFQFLGLVLIILFAWPLQMGAVGVTLSLTIITILSQLTYYWRLCLRLTNTRFRQFVGQVLLPGIAPALAGAMVWGPLKLVVGVDSWLQLVLYGAMGGIAYVLVLVLFCAEERERQGVIALVSRLRRP